MSIQHSTLPAFGFESAPYAYGEPKAQAQFKVQPKDFVVEEVLGFEPCGEGEHLFLLLQTDDHNTRYTQKCLAKYFQVAKNAVSYSGLKDRRGLTSQWFSIHLPGKNVEVEAQALQQQGITLLQHNRHNKKLRIGTHKRNRFHIYLREVSQPDDIESRIEVISQQGVPNYFGPQRFGHNANNIAEAMQWVEQVRLPDDRTIRSRAISTLRAWCFNGALAQRVEKHSWNAWQENDPIMLDGSQSYFMEEQWSEELEQRLQQGDIHMGGLLPGAESSCVEPNLQAFFSLAELKEEPRPFRLLPQRLQLEMDSSIEGNKVKISFELPKGAYATTVLRELVNLNDQSGSAQS